MIDELYPDRLLRYRYARIKSRDRLRIWIHHLVLNSLKVSGYPRNSLLVGLDPGNSKEPVWAAWDYVPVENSEEILENLLGLFWSGLVKPAHFFPESSWIYVHTLLEKKQPSEVAIEKALYNWKGSDYHRGECEDAYYDLCFKDTDPFDSEFQHASEKVFNPLLAHQKEI